MSMAQIAGKTAFLPMNLYEIEQFLYDLGLDGPGAEHHFEFIDGFFDDYQLDWGTDFRLANRLAQRISDLGDRRDTLKAWCCAQKHCTAEDALRASYHMTDVDFYPGVDSDEKLGQHALDNDIFYEYSELDDDVFAMLNRAKVGARMREMDGGRFVEGGYLLVGEDFSNESIPDEDPLAYFQVRFSDGLMQDSDWCDVPLSDESTRRIAENFGNESLWGLGMEYRSSLPRLNGFSVTAEDLQELGSLGQRLAGLSDEDALKYKALLEVEQPETPCAALRLAEDMDCYDVTPEYADPAVFGRQHAAYHYDLDEDCTLLDYVDLAGYGADMLRADGFESTRYGAVLLGPEQALAQEDESLELDDRGFGGMGGMA